MPRPLVTKEIAAKLGLSTKSICRLHREGKLPGSFKLGDRGSPARMPSDALDRLLERKAAQKKRRP